MKNIKKVISILILSLGIICLFQSDVKAANAKISVSNTNPKPGEKVTVTANVTAGAWNLKFSGNGKMKQYMVIQIKMEILQLQKV